MLFIDIILMIINRRHLINCMEKLNSIDQHLKNENININYVSIKKLTILLFGGIFIRAIFTLAFESDLFQINISHVLHLLTPICLSNLSKIWFIIFVYNIRLKFSSMNEFLIQICNNLEQKNDTSISTSTSFTSKSFQLPTTMKQNQFNNDEHSIVAINLLHTEILPQKNRQQIFLGQQKNFNFISNRRTMNTSSIISVLPYQSSEIELLPDVQQQFKKNLFNIHNDIEVKMFFLCNLHDEICEIGKIVNVLFSFQMLILMAYAFLTVTTELYFVYCALTDQSVPILFKAAENVSVSIVYFISTAFTCVFIVHMCWKTKIESNKMGIYMHRIANIVDDTTLYETVCDRLID